MIRIIVFALLFLPSTAVIVGCGPMGKSSQVSNLASTSATLSIAQSDKVQLTKGTVQISGSCVNGRDIELSSSALSGPVIVACLDSRFQVELQLSGPDGRVTITAKQPNSRGTPMYATIVFDKDSTAPQLSFLAADIELNAQGISPVVGRSLSIRGACENGLEVKMDGDLDPKPIFNCANAMFQGSVRILPGEGNKSIRATQTDSAGNSTTASREFLNDETPPNLTIATPTSNATVEPQNARFSGACESGLPVRLESASFQNSYIISCVDGLYSQLVQLIGGDGSKTVSAIQTDTTGNRRSLTVTFNVVTPVIPPPAVTIVAPAVNTLTRNSILLQGACEDGLPVTIQGAVAQNTSANCVNRQYSASVTLSAGDGVKSVTVVQTRPPNSVGSATRNFIKDATPPSITIVNPPMNAFIRTQVAVSGMCESGLMIQLQGTVLTSPQSIACNNGTFTANLTVSEGDGAKNLTASQVDAAGNLATASRTLNRDTVAPLLSITSPPAGTQLIEDKVNLSGSCESGLPVSVSGAGVAAPVSLSCANSTFASSLPLKPGAGTKEIRVEQTDLAGNSVSDSRSVERLADLLDGKLLYATNCASCHGALTASTKLNRTAQQITTALDTIPSMAGLKFLSSAEIQAIADALSDGSGVTNDMAPYYPGKYLPISKAYTCDPKKSGLSNDYIRRLTTLELTNSLTMYFGSGVMNDPSIVANLPLLPNEPDTAAVDGFNNNIFYVEGLFEVGRAITDHVFAVNARIETLLPSCSTAPTGATCKNSFAALAKRIFRRPLASAERAELESFVAGFTDLREGLKLAVLRLLMSPHFHQHMELDESMPSADGRLRLNQYEIASRLAFRITESGPDDILISAADQGQLATAAQVRAQAARLVETSPAKTAFKRFLIHWLELEPNVDPNPIMQTALGIDPQGFASEMNQEFSRFVDYVVFDRDGSFKDLLTAQYIFPLTPRLAKFLNTTQSSNPITSGPERAGILFRPLFPKSSTRESGIINRGVQLRKQFLCTNIPSPSASIVGSRLDEIEKFSHLEHSNRAIVTNVTNSPVCLSCHAQINPVGFVFENFGPFGDYRTVERVYDTQGSVVATHAVDPQVSGIVIPGRTPVSVSAPIQLAQALAQSDSAMRCFSQQIHRYSRMREAQMSDGCGLNLAADNLRNGGTIKNSIIENAASDEIFWRRKGN